MNGIGSFEKNSDSITDSEWAFHGFPALLDSFGSR